MFPRQRNMAKKTQTFYIAFERCFIGPQCPCFWTFSAVTNNEYNSNAVFNHGNAKLNCFTTSGNLYIVHNYDKCDLRKKILESCGDFLIFYVRFHVPML